MTFFSIIIPCYNVASFIDATISTVLEQDYRNMEIILIDDGSLDETSEKLSHYMSDQRVRVLSNDKNSGVSYTRNRGIEIAKGDFLVFLDSDDFFRTGLLTCLDDFIRAFPEMDLISFGYRIEKGSQVKHLGMDKYDQTLFEADQFLKHYLSREIWQHLCSMTVRTTLIKENAITFDQNTYAGEDQEFQIRSMLHARKIGYLSQESFRYRIREDSVMNVAFNEKRLSFLLALERLDELFQGRKDLYPYFVNYASMEYFSLLKHSIQSGNQKYIQRMEDASSILDRRGVLLANRQALVVYILKMIRKISRSGLYWLLSKF